MSHIIHMYRPFLNGCSFDVMTHIWLKIKRRLSFGFGFDSPNKFFVAGCFFWVRHEFERVFFRDFFRVGGVLSMIPNLTKVLRLIFFHDAKICGKHVV